MNRLLPLAIAVLLTATACKRKEPRQQASTPAASAQPVPLVSDAPPPEVPSAPAPAAEVPNPSAPASDPTGTPRATDEFAARFAPKTDAKSVTTRALASVNYRIDVFKENNGRFPKNLAEIGMDKVPLPPGHRLDYDPKTGAVQVVKN